MRHGERPLRIREEAALVTVAERHADGLARRVPGERGDERQRIGALEDLGSRSGRSLDGLGARLRRPARPGALTVERPQSRHEREECEVGERREGLGLVVAAPRHPREVQLHRHVAADRRHDTARTGGIGMLAQVLAELALDARRRLEDRIERAILLQQLRGRLLPHAHHTGDVVRAVALEAEVVRHLLRRHAVALEDRVAVVHDDVRDALPRAHDMHAVVHELQRVLVSGDEQDARTLGGGLLGERAEDVVALPALGLDDRHIERREERLDHRELRLEVRVRGRPLDLVRGECLGAESGLAAVERHDHTVGPQVGDQLDEHRHEAEHGVGGPAVRRGHRGRKPVERAVHETVAVDDGKRTFGHRSPFGCARA